MPFEVDRRAELRLLAAYDASDVARILDEAAAAGAKAAVPVVRDHAPVGRARLSSRYVRAGLRHGTFRATVRAAAIRKPGHRGQVIGPMGVHAYPRGWIEKRRPWAGRAASAAFAAARDAGDRVLETYAKARR